MATSLPLESPSNGSSQKKSRVAISCENCRQRKIKCNGSPAPCHHCAKIAIPCEFRQYARPERRRKSEADPSSTKRPRTAAPKRPTVIPENSELHDISDNETVQLPQEDNDGIAIAGSSVASEEFIGQSAIGSLLNGVQLEQPMSNGSHSSDLSNKSGSSILAKFSIDDFALPPREIADMLIANYFTYIHTIFPFLDQDEFQHDYASARHSKRPDQPMVWVLINLTMALGCHFVYRDRVHPDAGLYFNRARKLLQPYLLGTCQLSLVQALLLTSIYFQTTNMPSNCWSTIGQCVRLAHGLGLHLDMPSRYPSDSRKQEIRRRVWSTCVIFDRMVAGCWGRPTMIDDRTVKVIQMASPLPHSNACVPSANVECFNSLINLYSLVDEAMKKLYSLHIENVNTDSLRISLSANLLTMQGKLQQWAADLPDVLKWSEGWLEYFGDQDNLSHQRICLRALYLNYTIFIHRPSIDIARRNVSPLSVESNRDCSIQATLASTRACAAACVDVVKLSEHIQRANGFVGWWWYDTAFIFSSACVLLALETASPQSWTHQAGVIGQVERDALARAINMLNQLRHRGRNVDVSYRALNCIRESHSKGTDLFAMPASFLDPTSSVSDADLTRFFLEFESSGSDLRDILDDPYHSVTTNSSLFFGSAGFGSWGA